MRRYAVPAIIALVALGAACAPALVPAPVVTSPRFPEYTLPPLPQAFAGTSAAVFHDRAWRFFQSGDLSGADREVSAALSVAPAFYPAETMAGYVALARGDAKAALSRFDAAIRREGAYLSALVGRGQALVSLDREADAVAAFEAVLAVDGSLADIRRRVDVLRFRALERNLTSARAAARAGRADEAIAAYREALTSSPDSAFLYRELAQVERQRGDTERALEHYRRALTLDPDDAASHLEVGAILEERTEIEAALAEYERALAIDPASEARMRRDRIRTRMELARLPEQYRAINAAPEVTRADLAALIGVGLDAVLQVATDKQAVVITDVRANWAEPWIMAVARAGVLEPFANHTFQPAAIIRRQDLAQAVNRLLSRIALPAGRRSWQNARMTFADLSTSHLAFPDASAAVASGVMTIGPAGEFDPSRAVTGAEAIAAVARLQALAGSAARGDGRP
jgi:tetratricopeptide (TPR) repeat protein